MCTSKDVENQIKNAYFFCQKMNRIQKNEETNERDK